MISPQTNRAFYNKTWKSSHVFKPEHWGHWQIISSLHFKKSLEIGPGNRPKIPIKGGTFVDISSESLNKLRALGGKVHHSDLQHALSFPNNYFDLICCFETLEHLPNDLFLLREISRLLTPRGVALISFPINMSLWSDYDSTVGHCRRYEINQINPLFSQAGLTISQFAFLDVPWPGKIIGKITSFLVGNFRPLTSRFQDLTDSLPNSPLSQQIRLRPWPSPPPENKKISTIILLAHKVLK